jgi:ribosome-associated toxin RatA of RatAB toxin-antitoxin module
MSQTTPWVPGRIGAALLTAVLLVGAVAVHAAEWEKISDKAGLVVERRAVPGSRFFEMRATARSPLPPVAIFDTLWKHHEYPAFIPHLKRLDLLSDNGDERVAYEQLEVPLARDRDYTVRIRRRMDPTSQRYEISFATANDAGPPPDGHHVRVASIHGSWTVEPATDGKGSVVRYDVQSEPGGALPAWIVNRAQRIAIADLVRAVLARAQETSGQR